MTLWLAIHTFARLAIMAIFAVGLVVFYDQFNKAERIGLGVAGGSSLMVIPAIWRFEGNPFEAWAGAAFAVGILIFCAARFYRMWKHKRANDAQIAMARRRFEEMGK